VGILHLLAGAFACAGAACAAALAGTGALVADFENILGTLNLPNMLSIAPSSDPDRTMYGFSRNASS